MTLPPHRAKRGAAALALALLWPAQRLSAGDSDLDRVMGLLAQRPHGRASFVETQYLKILDRPVQSAGELIYDAPDHLEKRVIRPRAESLIAEHGVLTVQRGLRRTTLSAQSAPQLLPFIEGVRATLAGDRAALERIFSLQFAGSLDQWVLQLAPRDAKIASLVERIRIEGAQDAMRSVEILQRDGDRSVMIITPAPPPALAP